jgi:hypothetical protein
VNTRSILSFLTSSAIGGLVLATVVTAGLRPAPALMVRAANSPLQSDNPKLLALVDEDQRERVEQLTGRLTAEQLQTHTAERVASLINILREAKLRTANDYHRAAEIAQRSHNCDEVLQAHDWAITALALGDRSAGMVAASTEDRFLLDIGRPQQFGTQEGRVPNDAKLRVAPLMGAATIAVRSAQAALPQHSS